MARNNNFIGVQLRRPREQKQWFSIPRAAVFEAKTVAALETLINDWIDGLALPINLNFWTDIRDIQYSSAQESNNIISYSALVTYDVWAPR